MSGMLSYAHSIHKLEHLTSVDQIKKYDASGLGDDITVEEAMKLWEAYGKSTLSPQSVATIEKSVEWVKRLYEIGKNLSIITARSDMEQWKRERTRAWIVTYFPFLSEDAIHFVNHFSEDSRPKSLVCKNHNISLLIDDAIENAYELCNNGISCVLLEKPWNRELIFEHPLLYRAKDWKEIINSLPYEP
jgi:uncharacterized HAD superfamily protein